MKAPRILIVGCLVCLGPVAGAAPGNRDPKPEVLTRAMDGPLGDVEGIVFATRAAYDNPHWYANIGYYCDDEAQKAYAVVAQAMSTHRATGIIGQPAVGQGQGFRSAREHTGREI